MSMDNTRPKKDASEQTIKKKKKGLVIGICAEALLLVILVVGFLGLRYAEKLWNMVERPTEPDILHDVDPLRDDDYVTFTDEDGTVIKVNPNATVAVDPTQSGEEPGPADPTGEQPDDTPRQTGFKTFAVFGVDARNTSTKLIETHCDVCMIFSVNMETGEINLVSVYRDFYFWNGTDENGKNVYRKLTDTYYRLGAEQTVQLLNRNFDLQIDDFVTVNWQAVADCIDLMGGLDIDVTEKEAKGLNSCLWETARGAGIIEDDGDVEYVEETAGVKHLNGYQTVAFGRIRYDVGNDYGRTLRQRMVVKLALQKARGLSLDTLNRIATTIFPEVATSFDLAEVLELASKVRSFEIGIAQGFPLDRLADNSYIYANTLVSNVQQLHERLYGDVGFQPSNTVRAIGQGHVERIKEKFGE